MDKFKLGYRTPPLTKQLKNILDQYPDDGQILKELIQNAEDAGATEIKFLLDNSSYGTDPEKLIHPDLADFQGPALYAYNNAEFSDDDWDSIAMLLFSKKEDDPLKVGRYGMGFKAVYHMTDLPSIVSGDGIGFMDPHARYFKDPEHGNSSSSLWKFSEDRKAMKKRDHQFRPFYEHADLFGLSKETFTGGRYTGKTLFRFPLRSPETKDRSELSENFYTAEKVRKLFNDLEKDGGNLLLFLRHLQHIAVYEKTSEHKKNALKQTMDIRMDESCMELVSQQHLKFQNCLNLLKTDKMTDKTFSVSFPIKIEVKSGLDTKVSRSYQNTFIVTHYYSENTLNTEAKHTKDSLKVLPWVGAAIQLDSRPVSSEGQGRIYCFLPLPLEARSPTGLSTHVHGYFVLDQNRRHLKWPDAGSNAVSDRHHVWNLFLMKELVPRALVQMTVYISELQRGAQQSEHLGVVTNFRDKNRIAQFQVDTLNSVMPNLETVNPGWQPLVETFYKEIVRHQAFYSKAKDGTWQRIYDTETIVDNSDETTDLAKLLRKILIASNKTLVSVPEFVIIGIERFSNSLLRRIQPDDICACLKTNPIELDNKEKLCLLQYLLKKLEEKKQLCQLIGIPLLPLDNGSWIKFESNSPFASLPARTKIYIETLEHPQYLLPGIESQFVSSSVKGNKVLQSIAETGIMQLKMLDKNSVLQLLGLVPGLAVPHQVSLGLLVLPPSQQALVIKNTNANLTQEYFERLWQYVEKHWAYDLRTLANSRLYLMPFNQYTQLALLSENLPLIVWKKGEHNDIKKALKSLGVAVLEDVPKCVCSTQGIMGKYILKLNLSGILEVLLRIQVRPGSLAGKFVSLAAEEKDAFREYIGLRLDSEEIGNAEKELLRSLPLFRTLNQSGFKPEHFVSLETVKWAVSSSFHLPVSVPSVLIQLQGPSSDRLKASLDIQVLKEADVLCTFVFPLVNRTGSTVCSPHMIEEVMKFSLKNLELFERQRAGFVESVSQLRFLSTGLGQTLKMPCELFDDSSKLVRDFFYTCNIFPVGEFPKAIYRKELLRVGLKGSDKISAEDFLTTAKELHGNPAKTGILKRASAMLTLLNSSLKPGIFNNTEKLRLKDQLSSLKWILPCRIQPKDYPENLAFVGKTSPLLAPEDAYQYPFSHVVGSVKATVDLEGLENLAKLFGCAREPTVQEVIRHLDNIASLHSSDKERTARGKRKLKDTIVERQVDKKVTKACEKVYEFLNDRVETNREYLSTLSEKNYILVNGHFMKPSRCALQSQLSCLPFLCSIPDTSCKDLWQALGVKTQFDVDSYVQIVQEIYDDIGLQPLSTSELNTFLRIIGECTSGEESQPLAGRNVYLPDHYNILCLASQLSFNDSPWLPITADEKVKICHRRIPYPDAQKLGVTSWRQKTVQNHRQKLPGHKFGQKEKLVNRLKRILDGYPMNDGILKELIQNADDAGATKIHFIRDMRTLPSEKIFDDKWKPLQGISLCVYNDKPFTQEDLEGIQNLGEGSKSKERTKIGQYGVGFNCVYHLTDVPTFVTTVGNVGRVLCVLDPTLQHVDGASEESPGFMFDKLDTLKDKFPDVFCGYLEKYYGTSGTVFRFPLRKTESAISHNVVTKETLGQLFKIMENEMHTCLLFLNNVREIALKEIKPNGQLVEIFCVQAKLDKENQKKLNSFRSTSKEVCSELEKGGSLQTIKAKNIMYTMETSDRSNGKHQWLIAQQLGFNDPSCVSKKLEAAYKKGALNHLPLGGVAYEMNQTQNKVDSKLFCFLPLPKTIHLPVHVNGHFCLDTESRRNLIEDDKDEIQKDWNDCLMENVVSHAYCSVISKTKDSANQDIQNSKRNSLRRNGTDNSNEVILKKYQLVFPNVSESDGIYVRKMCVSVYRILWKLNLSVLPLCSSAPDNRHNSLLNITWVGPQGTGNKKPCFDLLRREVSLVFKEQLDTQSKSNTDEHNQIERQLRKVLISCGFPLVHSSCQLHYNFTKADLTVECSSPDTVLQFFASFKETYPKCTIQPLPCKLAQTPFESVEAFVAVLQYCSHSKNFSARLKSAPFLLTADEYLREFDARSKPYFSSYCDLVPHALHMFAHVKAKKILRSAGMTRDFNVADLAGLLPGLLPEKQFTGSDNFVQFEFFSHFLQEKAPVKLTVSPETFLKRIWDFITRYADAKDYPRLSSWCLLPVSTVEGNLLLPISKANHVIEESKLKNVDQKLLTALITIGMPALDHYYVFSSTIEKLLDESVHLSVAIVKHFIGHKGSALNVAEERNSLLKYLSDCQSEWKSITEARGAICRLAVFEHFGGTIGDLEMSKRYIVPSSFPNDELAKWALRDDAVFLTYSAELLQFLKLLGCECISEDQLYCQFIFKRFSVLAKKSRHAHLTFIKDILIDRLKTNPESLKNLQKNLQSLKFLPRRNGSELCCASTFFDFRVDIFQIMQDNSDFPPKPYNSDDWLDFLQFCGLVYEVTEDHLLRYAEEVTRENKDVEDEEPVRKKAKLLVENIMELEDLSDGFVEKLKTMPIVEAAVVPDIMKKLHLQKSDPNKPFISYKDAYKEKHRDLVWTTSDMLPRWATATRKRKLLKLEVRAMPLTEIVTQHLVNICTSFLNAGSEQKAEVKKEFFRVIREIYKFLGSNDIANSSIRLLTNCQCIVLDSGEELAQPDQVVITMTEENEIRPYLYKLSLELYEYIPFFQKLHMAQDLQPEHYAGILNQIYEKVGRAKLVPNDRKLVLMAFAGFLKQLCTEGSLTLKELILPSDNGKLYRSSELVINNDSEFAERARKCKSLAYLIDLDDLNAYGISEVTYKIFEKLPELLRPSLLSCVVTQKLKNLPGISGKNKKSSRICDTITSQEFTDGLCRLLHCKPAATNNSTLAEKIKDLSKIEIYELPKVVTYLDYKEERIPGSEKECSFFVTSNAEATATVVYIDKNLLTDIKEANMLNIKLAEIVNEILGGALESVLLYVPLMFQCDPHEISCTLDKLGHPGSVSSKKADRSQFLPTPGSYVPIDMHHMLQQGFYSFKKGDIAALEYGDLKDSIYIMVEIIEEISGECDSESMLNARYKVNTGENGEQTVNGSDLYQFCSPPSFDETGALVLVSVPSETHSQEPRNVEESLNYNDIIRDIKKRLIEARSLPEDQQRRVIKRLYLRWHPDKNPPHLKKLCTQVVQTLQNLVKRLDSLSLEEEDEEETSSRSTSQDFPDSSFRQSRFQSRNRASASSSNFNFQNFDFGCFDETAKKHRQQSKAYGNQSSSSSSQHGFFSFGQAFTSRPNPQPQEAKRWMQQAEYDLESAAVDKAAKFYEWSCYKYHQAAEKSLKAIHFKRDANQNFTHKLSSLCSSLSDRTVIEWVAQLERLIPNPAAMRYPNCQNYPRVPHDVYNLAMTGEVGKLAANIVGFARNQIV